jgi:hypothetical protein
MTDRDELQRRARHRLAVLRRREKDPRFLRAMGRFVHEGLLSVNRDVAPHREPLAIEDVLWAGELEPRLLELLPALIVKRPRMFTGTGALPEDLARVVADLRRDRVPPDFRGLKGPDLHRWLRRVGRKGKMPALLRSFRLRPEDLRLLEHLSKELGLSQTDVIRRGLRGLVR